MLVNDGFVILLAVVLFTDHFFLETILINKQHLPATDSYVYRLKKANPGTVGSSISTRVGRF